MPYYGTEKMVRVDQLRLALEALPPDFLVAVNAVGNITIYNAEQRYVGYVDMVSGEVDMLDNEG